MDVLGKNQDYTHGFGYGSYLKLIKGNIECLALTQNNLFFSM